MEQEASEIKEAAFFTGAFSSFSVNDMRVAREFYGKTLGVDISTEEEGLTLKLPGGGMVFLYPKSDHEPATFTVLNLMVNDIEQAVDELRSRGIDLESYGGGINTDENGIFRGKDRGHGPNIAWFKDPAGNIISVTEGK